MNDVDRRDWERYAHGDDQSLESIYSRHRQRLLNYCVYVTKSREIGEEIVQETFVRLMSQRENLVIKTSLKDWLFICARNLCLNHLRVTKHQASLSEFRTEQAIESDSEMRHFIGRVLNQLTTEERDLILMREQQQYTISEIAHHLSASEEAIRVRLFRVRKKMQQLGKEHR